MKLLTNFPFAVVPFKHQAVEFIQHKNSEFSALFWEMGTGKTKAAIDKGAWLYSQKKVNAIVFVAPKGVHIDHIRDAVPLHWPKHLDYVAAYWLADAKKIERSKFEYVLETRDDACKILAFNVDSLLPSRKSWKLLHTFLKNHRVFVVVDEATEFKNPKAKRTIGLLRLREVSDYRMIMDGTPITQGPSDIYAPMDFLKSGLLGYTSYTAFQARYEVRVNPQILAGLKIALGDQIYADRIYNLRLTGRYIRSADLKGILPYQYHGKIGTVLSILNQNALFRVGYRNIEELYEKIQPYSTRYLKDECLDLPDKLFENLVYEMPDEQRKWYDQLVEDMRVVISDVSEMTTSNVLTLYQRLQQMIGGWYVDDDTGKSKRLPGAQTRLSVMFDSIRKLPEDSKVVIWSVFVREIEDIVKWCSKLFGKESVVSYYGATSNNDRQIAKERFESDPICRFFIGHPKSGGKGLNQLVAGNYMYWYNRPFSLGVYNQAVDRIHRPGQKKNCTIIGLVANDTIDDHISEAHKNKQSIADYITGDYLRCLR